MEVMEFIEISPPVLLLSALVCAVFANIDNRSPAGFFLLGIVCPPLALLILAVTRKDENNRMVFIDIINGRNGKKADKYDWIGLFFSLTLGILVFAGMFYFS